MLGVKTNVTTDREDQELQQTSVCHQMVPWLQGTHIPSPALHPPTGEWTETASPPASSLPLSPKQ